MRSAQRKKTSGRHVGGRRHATAGEKQPCIVSPASGVGSVKSRRSIAGPPGQCQRKPKIPSAANFSHKVLLKNTLWMDSACETGHFPAPAARGGARRRGGAPGGHWSHKPFLQNILVRRPGPAGGPADAGVAARLPRRDRPAVWPHRGIMLPCRSRSNGSRRTWPATPLT